MKRLLPLLLIPLFFAGCETVNRQDRAVLRAHEVPEDVFEKMLYGDPLSVDDVITLSHHAVPAGLIIHYMDETDSVYHLPKAEVKHLHSAGVSDEVISYMLSTAPPYAYRGGYGGGYPPPYGGYPYPYGGYYDPYDYGYGYGYGGPVVVVGGYHHWWGHGCGWGHGGDGHHHH